MALNFNLNSLFEPALLADEPWWSYILGGAGWTVALMLSSFALALALGIIVGTLRTSQNKFLSTICEVWMSSFAIFPSSFRFSSGSLSFPNSFPGTRIG